MLDTDTAIEKKTGRTIADIFANDGEAEFRRIEEDVVRDALATHDGVLSLGGGAVTTPVVREALAGHTVIYLEISAAEGRAPHRRHTMRPLLAGRDRGERFKELSAQRVPLYRQVATYAGEHQSPQPGRGGALHRVPAGEPRWCQFRPSTRRPAWRRAPMSLTAQPSTEAPPSPPPRGQEDGSPVDGRMHSD